MAHDRDRQSDSCGVVAAALLALFVVTAIAGMAGYFTLRAARTQRQMAMAMKEAEHAYMKAEQARAEAEAAQEREQALAEANPESPPTTDATQIIIRIDKHGHVSMDSDAIAMDRLPAELRRQFDASRKQLPVVIQVSGQCPFEHVARTRSVCQEAGAMRVQLAVFDQDETG